MGNIKGILDKINSKLKSTNRLAFVLYVTIALYFVKYLFIFFYTFMEEKDTIWYSFPLHKEKIVLFFLVIIVAPVFETWFAQSLPYSLLNKVKYLKDRSYLILLISGIFFGLNHFYSLFYMFYGFLMGLVFMHGYMVRIKTDNKTFYLIAICHSLVNLGGFIINLF